MALTGMDEKVDPIPAHVEAIAHAIFEAIADPVFVVDFVSDDVGPHFRYANDAACRLLNRSREEILKLRPGTVDDIPQSVRDEAYHRLVTEGRATFETLMIAADGTRIPMEIHASDAWISGQRLCVAVARSLVARKEIDRQMREAKEAAEAANRAKSEFLAVMSHEIRTPLHGVIGFASLLNEANVSPGVREAINGIRDSANLLLSLVTDVLDLSRMESGLLELKPAPVDLASQVRRMAATFKLRAMEKHLDFAFRGEDSLPPAVYVDVVRIEQVLGNLLGNALKFTDNGSISLEVRSGSPRSDGSREIAFIISDTGIGIPPDQLPRLFNRFSQVDASPSRRYGGSGLGLVISRKLCEIMGGTVSAESEFGKGSIFTATVLAGPLPRSVGTGSEELLLLQEFGSHSLRILVAEDNAINQRLLKRMIERLGLTAQFAVDGREALDMAANASFDLILMDVSMPGVSGLEATRSLRKLEAQRGGQRSWVVAITAGVSEKERKECLDAGMDDFLGKPFTESGLREAILRIP